MAPKDGIELEEMLEFAVRLDKPVAIRYPRAAVYKSDYPSRPLEIGRAEVLKEGKDFVLIALGSMIEASLGAVELLEKEGLKGTLINARFIKPLDIDLFKAVASRVKFIFSAEEGIIDGGFGSAISEAINLPVIKIGLPDEFIPHGTRAVLLEKYGLTAKGIADKILSTVRFSG